MKADKYIGRNLIDQAIEHAQVYRRCGDEDCRRALVSFGLVLVTGIAVEQGWSDPSKDYRPRGLITALVEAAIDEACGWGANWQEKTIPGNSLQDRKWRPRYEELRECLLELVVGEKSEDVK